MSDQIRTVVCQRCGIGFTLTENYLEWLARRGARVVVPVLCTTCFMKAGLWPKQQGQVKWFNSRKHYGFTVDKGKKSSFINGRLSQTTKVMHTRDR